MFILSNDLFIALLIHVTYIFSFMPRSDEIFIGPKLHFVYQRLTQCLCLSFSVHSLPHLTVLSLSGCSKITDDGVELIAENLQKLRALDLSWCPRITDAALEYIACDLNMLEELTLDRFELCLSSPPGDNISRFDILDASTLPTLAWDTFQR